MEVCNKFYSDQSNYVSFPLQITIKGIYMGIIDRVFFVKTQNFAILIGTALQAKLRKSCLQP